jgi:BNR repeat-like domain
MPIARRSFFAALTGIPLGRRIGLRTECLSPGTEECAVPLSWNRDAIRDDAIDPATGYACRAGYDLSKETGFADTDPISTLTDHSGNGLDLTAARAVRPTFQANELNGYGVARFDGTDDVLSAATAADWKFLHDGHGVTVVALVRQSDENTDRLNTIIDTCRGSSGNHGVFVGMDNRLRASRSNGVTFTINKGVGGRPILAAASNGNTRPRTWHLMVCRYACESNAVEQFGSDVSDGSIFVDGLAVAGANAANLGHSTSNPTHALKVGHSSSLYSKMDLAGLWVFDIALPDDLLSAYLRWITQRFDIGYNRIVSPRYGTTAFPGLATLSDGTVICVMYESHAHDPTGLSGRLVERRSGNLGWDWSLPREVCAHTSKDTRGATAFKTSAGTLLVAGFTDDGNTDIDVFVMRSTDDGTTWGSPITPAHGFTLWSASGANFVELSNGDLLLAVYGLDTAGTYTSTKTVLSTDDGATWGGAVTIADGPASSKQWSEAGIVKIDGTHPHETLLALIRNDTDNCIDKVTSTDSGATWSAVSSCLTGLGGLPFLMKSASGHLYCFCRQRLSPNRSVIRWSGDGGTTWSATDYNIDALPAFNNYSAAVETSTGKFLVVTASEPTRQSSNPTMSLLRCRVHLESEIQLYT